MIATILRPRTGQFCFMTRAASAATATARKNTMSKICVAPLRGYFSSITCLRAFFRAYYHQPIDGRIELYDAPRH